MRRSNGSKQLFNDTVLNVAGLACGRRGQMLAEDVAFELAAGNALLLEGANGSGKTSLLRTLAGLTPAQQGRLTWHGRNVVDDVDTFRSALVYIGHDNGIEPELTVTENLRVLVTLGGEYSRQPELHSALANVGLEELWERPARLLSQGQKRRIAMARLWCTHKPLWLLDEPLAGLDQQITARLEALLTSHLNSGGLAVIATHQPMLETLRPDRLLLSPD